MISPARWPRVVATLYRTFGARGVALRAAHEVRRAAGLFRASPRHPGASLGSTQRLFAVDPDQLQRATDRGEALRRADRVVRGEHQAYRWDWRRLPRTPQEWSLHPRTGADFLGDVPWWAVPHLGAERGDIKDVWEPGRFAWAYDLVRGWLLTRDDRYALAFHRQFRTWSQACTPFRGPHWGCGQETAIRAVALLYAEASLADAPSSNSGAMSELRATLAASGERIADALGYAMSQRNNHAVSEATGLVLLGQRFRGVHPEAGKWMARGVQVLEVLVQDQFAADGWYAQHSFTYARLALEQLALAQRALRADGDGLSNQVRGRVAAAVDLLGAVADARSGTVPNHGPNDGAFVYPATLAPYRDFRPAITAAAAAFDLAMPAGLAPDAEVCAWLGLPEPERSAPEGDLVRSGPSGWAVARVAETVVFLRAGRYWSRPGHLDPLQLEVRFGGQEVIVDPGTFAYNAAPPWRNGLVWARVHNGPLLDGTEPGVRGPRFLWYLWPDADLLEVRRSRDVAVLSGETAGRVRRAVRVASDRVEVVDTALADADHMVVRWLLHPDADPACVEVEGGAVLRQASEEDVLGWYSPHYGARIASQWWEVIRRPVTVGTRVVTVISAR